jgi:hypothetical protein
MGANMARRLKECGYEIAAVYDVNRAAAQSLAQELGCPAAEELRQVTNLCDVVFTVVTDDRAMKEIYSGGLLRRAQGMLFINCATVTPDVHVWVEAKAEKAGAESLEACMASSITQARLGILYLMCGGRREVFDRAKPLLEKLGTSVRYIGAAGQAAQVKALVNMVMNINTAALAEGLALGDALGWTWRCSARSSRRPGPTRKCSRPTARTCRTATMPVSSPRPTLPKTPASPSSSASPEALSSRSRRRRRSNTTGWSPKVWANSTSRALRS